MYLLFFYLYTPKTEVILSNYHFLMILGAIKLHLTFILLHQKPKKNKRIQVYVLIENHSKSLEYFKISLLTTRKFSIDNKNNLAEA